MAAITDMVGDYNSKRPQIILKEYGRNIQKIAEHISTLPSQEERLKKAEALVSLMKQLNPKLKESQDLESKLWKHLHIVADNTLNLENSPEAVEEAGLSKTPRLPYTTGRIKVRHLGGNVENIAKEAAKIEDPTKKEEATIYLARLIKRYFATWNNGEKLDDEIIVEQISRLSNGGLSLSLSKIQDEDLLNVDLRGISINRNNRSRANNNSNYRRNNGGSGSKGGRPNNNNRRRR